MLNILFTLYLVISVLCGIWMVIDSYRYRLVEKLSTTWIVLSFGVGLIWPMIIYFWFDRVWSERNI